MFDEQKLTPLLKLRDSTAFTEMLKLFFCET
jgi:hypothetical protein